MKKNKKNTYEPREYYSPTILKRSEIIACPFFRMSSWELTRNRVAYDMSCYLDELGIFVNYNTKGIKPTRKEKKHMRDLMLDMCSNECPKIWDCVAEEDHEAAIMSSEDRMIEQMLDDQCSCLMDDEENEYLMYGWKKEIEEVEANLKSKQDNWTFPVEPIWMG